MRKRFLYTALIFITGIFQTYAQDKGLGTEEVNVVKQYNPTVQDAEKIKETPVLTDSVTTTKKEINYTIFSVPVASTFTPAKGKASVVQKAEKEKLYNSYASVGIGNFNTGTLDFYTSRALNRDETLDVNLNHHSSQGGIDGVTLDDKFFNTKLGAAYNKKDRYLSWGANAGFQHQIYNWYGIDETLFTPDEINTIEERQRYMTFEAGANVEVPEFFFKGGDFLYRNFTDRFGSTEHRLQLKPSFEVPISSELISLDVSIDYLNGGFERGYASEESINYSTLIAGVTPGLVILRDNVTVNMGATFAYGLDAENSDSNFFIYPNITASVRVVDEYLTLYGGIQGALEQNSFHGFASENPFVSPTLSIIPTDKKYDAYAGVKGKFSSSISYNLKGSYLTQNNKPLFVANALDGLNNTEGYAFGNSFGIVYDDVKTISVFGEINVDVNRNFTLGVNAEVLDYNTDNQAEAWNLPNLKGSLFTDFKIGKHWFGGANIYFVGEREDVDATSGLPDTVTLKSFFDANANVGYRFTDQLSAFMKLNNIANNEYARWANYQVQGLQILLGASYKFDF